MISLLSLSVSLAYIDSLLSGFWIYIYTFIHSFTLVVCFGEDWSLTECRWSGQYDWKSPFVIVLSRIDVIHSWWIGMENVIIVSVLKFIFCIPIVVLDCFYISKSGRMDGKPTDVGWRVHYLKRNREVDGNRYRSK
jgi:hypothetical protein